MGVVDTARSKLGAPYVWGAKGPDTFDCSGLYEWAWAQNGVSVPGFTDAIADATPQVSGPPQPGDAILYRYDDPTQPNVRFPHIDMSEGGDQVIGARFSAGAVVEGTILNHPYEIHRPGAAPQASSGDLIAQLVGGNVNYLALGAAGLALLWALDLV